MAHTGKENDACVAAVKSACTVGHIPAPDCKPIVGLQIVAPATIKSYEDFFS